MVSGPIDPSSSTVPSGAALATNWWAMLPPAPPLLSTTTCWPMFSPSFLAIRRAAASAAPPAAKPTTRVTGFLGGKSWACRPPVAARAPVVNAAACSSHWRLFIEVSLLVRVEVQGGQSTTLCKGWPVRQRARLSRNSASTLSALPSEKPALCGVAMTWGSCHSGESGGRGSCANTSR